MSKQSQLIHNHPERSKKKGKGKKHYNNQVQNAPKTAEPVRSSGKQYPFDTIHGMKMKEVEYKVPPKPLRQQRRKEFNKIRGTFLRHLAENHADLLVERLGLTDDQIAAMKEGKTPNGFNVHHKLPIHGGGKNEFSNFILTPLYPHDQWHHDIIDQQIKGVMNGGSVKIQLPWTDEMIYDPKTYGYFRDGKEVDPGFVSRVNPNSNHYMKNWLPEHIEARRKKAPLQMNPVQKAVLAKRFQGR